MKKFLFLSLILVCLLGMAFVLACDDDDDDSGDDDDNDDNDDNDVADDDDPFEGWFPPEGGLTSIYEVSEWTLAQR